MQDSTIPTQSLHMIDHNGTFLWTTLYLEVFWSLTEVQLRSSSGKQIFVL